jgi:hypothetical protein
MSADTLNAIHDALYYYSRRSTATAARNFTYELSIQFQFTPIALFFSNWSLG